ncbi:MAG: nicotinate phosphoribosyltransferase, partial [Oscillospiraceae bacterium]
LAAVKENGEYIPKIKLSESAEKITLPHLKKLWRIYDNETGKAMADYITMWDESVSTDGGISLFDPVQTWKTRTFTNVHAELLSTVIYENGKRVYDLPKLCDIRAFCAKQIDTLWDEVTRFENPHRYYVDLSRKLWDERNRLLTEFGR